jgi:predicted lipoprotein with Yx(FWY)xxD motif
VAASPPSTPPEISVFQEDGAYVFRTSDGLAIYSAASDHKGRSSCFGACARTWPPVLAPRDAAPVADWTPIARGGARQWAYKGKPVYTYFRDHGPAANGDGIGGVWRQVKP